MMNVIKVQNLRKVFSTKKNKIKALDDISLQIAKGEIYGILGVNGAGKSTLIKIMTGILRLDAGQVYINNHMPKEGRIFRRQFTVSYQNYGLDMYLCVWDNLFLHCLMFGLEKAEAKGRVEDVLARFNLHSYKDRRIGELSGGYRKRVQVARGFLVDTPVLILDEPTEGMDPFVKRVLLDELSKESETGRTIVLTTQRLDEAESICSKICIMEKGQKVVEDSLKNLKQIYGKQRQLVLETGFIDVLERDKISDILEDSDIIKFEEDSLSIFTPKDTLYLMGLVAEISKFIEIKNLEIKNASFEDVFFNIAHKS